MNTKQLWNALMNNSVTESYFDGVFPSDMIKDITVKPQLIICNTDPSTKKGEHWILFFFTDNCVEFYDSLGKDLKYYGLHFIKFVNTYVTHYKQSKIRTQPFNTSFCGEYCLYYAYLRCKGYDMDYIINNMTSVSKVLNLVKNKFCICKNSKCLLLQDCICK